MEMMKFEPLLKQTIWGGNKIVPFKHLDSTLKRVGESWEISGVEDNETVVANGKLKGRKLNDIVREYGTELVGHKNYEQFGNEFPLLIKFIDAQQDLSIQVHPDDATAIRHGKKRGKTEMWYVLESEPSASLYCGLRVPITPEEYTSKVEKDTITTVLTQYGVHEGDVFFIPAGRIHAIGAGCFVAEIQQTSDVTYRIYDFNRRDEYGNRRKLHTKEAAESIDYRVLPDYRTSYTQMHDSPVPLVDCPYFTTNINELTKPRLIDYSYLDSFVILIGVKGQGTVTADGQTLPLCSGETILVPATIQKIYVEGTVKFLETYIK